MEKGSTKRTTTKKEPLAVKVKLITKTAKLPIRANPTDAGADLFATEEIVIGTKQSKFMDFGIQMEIPDGYAGFIFARSGLGSKNGIRPRNAVGVIDAKYRGNLGMMVENNGDTFYHIHTGDRIAQIVFIKVEPFAFEKADYLDESDNRGGGFGSTGVK